MQVYSHDYSLSFLDGPSLDDARFEAMVLRLHSVIDVAGLWSAVQVVLNELVPNDACILHLNRKILATANAQTFYKWMAHRPERHLIPTAILANPETKVCQLSDVVFDPRQLFHSEFFLRHMAPQGWHHIACSLFWKDHQLTAEIAITRTAKQGPFTDLEVALLERLHPHIEVTLQRLTALNCSTSYEQA